MAHNFSKSLVVGKAGEKAFMALAAAAGITLEQTDGRKGDFVDEHGSVWEVKSDSYDHDRTANFFIERYSNIDKGTDGGPWQSLAHGCTYFAYFFPLNNIAYVFKTVDLVEQLRVTPLGNPIDIRNVRHTTVGFKIPRVSLKPDFVLDKDGRREA